MPFTKQRSLFISHSWEYSDAYKKFKNLLDKDPLFNYKNYSVPKDSPVHNAPTDKALIEAIQQRVAFCDVVLILAGVYSSYSKWINKEIKIAKNFTNSKPIIAIEPFSSQKTSLIVKNSADEIVKWNSSSIISAIRRLSP